MRYLICLTIKIAYGWIFQFYIFLDKIWVTLENLWFLLASQPVIPFSTSCSNAHNSRPGVPQVLYLATDEVQTAEAFRKVPAVKRKRKIHREDQKKSGKQKQVWEQNDTNMFENVLGHFCWMIHFWCFLGWSSILRHYRLVARREVGSGLPDFVSMFYRVSAQKIQNVWRDRSVSYWHHLYHYPLGDQDG